MSYPPPLQPEYFTPPANLPTGMAIASMVCGIVSLPLLCFWYVGLPLAIVAIVLGVVAKQQARRGQAGGVGMATAGIVCGSVTLCIVLLVVLALCVMGVGIFFASQHH